MNAFRVCSLGISHSLDLFGLYTRNLRGNRGEVPVEIVWILGADAMSLTLSSLDGSTPRTGGEVRYCTDGGLELL